MRIDAAVVFALNNTGSKAFIVELPTVVKVALLIPNPLMATDAQSVEIALFVICQLAAAEIVPDGIVLLAL